MPSTPDLLARLRPDHLPDAVSWWPPAPGWWLLAAVVLLGLATLNHRRRRRKPLTGDHALTLLRELGERDGDDAAFLAELNATMKRLALHYHPHGDVAPLSGDAWLAFLDQSGDTSAFSNGPGALLALDPYRREADGVDRAALLVICIEWLQRQEAGR